MWPSEISTILAPILTEALTVSRSEKGNIQLFMWRPAVSQLRLSMVLMLHFSLHSSQSQLKTDAPVGGLSVRGSR